MIHYRKIGVKCVNRKREKKQTLNRFYLTMNLYMSNKISKVNDNGKNIDDKINFYYINI